MHAERDYLIKRVFPQLSEWCELRRLRLVDIDLRWGVTEKDSKNKNTIKVYLDRIDDCRPFFVCFLGQRRGWVPPKDGISSATYDEFPILKERYAGGSSATELEIIHALLDPLRRGKQPVPNKPGEYYEPAKYAFFFLREDSYLKDIPEKPPELRNTFTNGNADDDQELEKWRTEKIPATGRPGHAYTAHWNPDLNTPELGIPGRLTDFQCQSFPLDQVILEDLQQAIAARYPDHGESDEMTDLQKEIDQQGQFLFVSSEEFISRGNDFKELDEYILGPSNQIFVLTAPAGTGKSILLAKWIDHYRNDSQNQKPGETVHYRFIGRSNHSTTVNSLLHFLVRELKEMAGKIGIDIPEDPQKLRQEWLRLLESAGKQGKTILVLDALNQLESGLADLAWLPYELPRNVKLIVSFKRGNPEAEELYQQLAGKVQHLDVRPFKDPDDRNKLVKTYLSQYLKDLDEPHIKKLISSPGAENPLFLKVILSELRVFGAYDNLGEKIRTDFGETPVSAFEGLLRRLENDPAYSPIDPQKAVPLLFGLLAHARKGLSREELIGLFIHALEMEDNDSNRQMASDSVYLYLRQLRSYLSSREGRFDFFFESFKQAALACYRNEAGNLPTRTGFDWHKLLADYFSAQSQKAQCNIHSLEEVPYHLAESQQYERLADLLCSIPYLDARSRLGDLYELIEDYNLLPPQYQNIASQYSNLLRKHAQRLSKHRGLLFTIIQHEGFPEALLQANALTQGNQWLRPWLHLEPLPIPSSGESDASRGKLNLLTQCALEAPVASAIAADRSITLFVKRIGQIGIIDLERGLELPQVINLRLIRPTALYCSADAKYIAIAFENGQADVLNLDFNSAGSMTGQRNVATLEYQVPEFGGPGMGFIDYDLWYQQNSGVIARFSPAQEIKEFYQQEIPREIAGGELSGVVSPSGHLVFLIRHTGGTWIVSVGQAEGFASLFLPGLDIEDHCACGERFAVAFNKRKMIVFKTEAGNINIVDDIPLSETTSCLSWTGRELVWVSKTNRLYNYLPGVATSLHLIEGIGPEFSGSQQLHARPDGKFDLVSALSAVRFSIISSKGSKSLPVHAVFQIEEAPSFFAVQENENGTWLFDSRSGSVTLIDNQDRPSVFLFNKDGFNNVLAVRTFLGRAVWVDPGKQKAEWVTRIPPNTTSVAGDPFAGFWLTDSSGRIYFLSHDKECRMICETGFEDIGQSRVLCVQNLLIWSGTCMTQTRFGTDTIATMVFFNISKGGNVTNRSERLFPIEDGPLIAMAYDPSQERLLSLWGDGRHIKIGSPKEYTEHDEKDVSLKGVDASVLEARFTRDGSGIYLLCNNGTLFRLDGLTYKVQTVFSASTSISGLAQGGQWTRSQILIGNGSLLFSCEFEGARHVVS